MPREQTRERGDLDDRRPLAVVVLLVAAGIACAGPETQILRSNAANQTGSEIGQPSRLSVVRIPVWASCTSVST